MAFDRAAGVLLHPTSLPGPFGIGDFGPEAHRYVDWLADAGVTWWQLLPLNVPGEGNSPYAARSTFALNVILASPELLQQDGLVDAASLAGAPEFAVDRVDYEGAKKYKRPLLRHAYERFTGAPSGPLMHEFDQFRAAENSWLDDYALFAALRAEHGGSAWFEWPEGLALRDPRALAGWRVQHDDEVRFQEFTQFIAARQWRALRRHANGRGVRIMGDLPMFVALDSAEVWAHRDLFELDPQGRPTYVAGVPPDYFNDNGQLWGNPLYDWDVMERDGFAWWVDRIRRALENVDALRLDHFRGFSSYWQVPASEKTARNGVWRKGPGRRVFDALSRELGDLPFLAEDLGDIDQPVLQLREELGLPGMAVLQFAFSPAPRSTFLPYNHERHQAVYTGTHDNNTARGWYEEDAGEAERDFLRRYLATGAHEVAWDMIRSVLGSVADLAIVPHQDLADLGPEGRMNRPGTGRGNWSFRLAPWMLGREIQARLADLVWLYGRRPDQRRP